MLWHPRQTAPRFTVCTCSTVHTVCNVSILTKKLIGSRYAYVFGRQEGGDHEINKIGLKVLKHEIVLPKSKHYMTFGNILFKSSILLFQFLLEFRCLNIFAVTEQWAYPEPIFCCEVSEFFYVHFGLIWWNNWQFFGVLLKKLYHALAEHTRKRFHRLLCIPRNI